MSPVLDVDATYKAALEAGATGAMPPTDFADIGRGARSVGPTGAQVTLWTGTRDDRPDVDPVPVGDWCWNELLTPTDQEALAFYEKVIGYTHEAMDMGPQGTYYLLVGRDGKRRAGLMTPPMPVPAMWVPYVRVADCDASADKAVQFGGKTVVPPTDIPNVGRFSVLLDPQQGVVAIIKPNMVD